MALCHVNEMNAMRLFRAAALVATIVSSLAALHQEAKAAEVLRPSQIIANLDDFMQKRVTVRGMLVNEGTNYFTDRRLVLKDASGAVGNGLAVMAWVPAETAPGQNTQSGSASVLSDYLDKTVVMEGVIGEITQKGIGKTKGLRVESVKIAD